MVSTSKTTLRRSALYYAKHYGWPIFPCVPQEKRPLTKNGCKDATTDLDVIEQWWQKWPQANIGMACGAVSGIVAVDIDGEAGWESLDTLEKNKPFPTTMQNLTPNGAHYLFKAPNCNFPNAVKVLPGIDLRGDGGYIIIPPSIHPSEKLYAWEVSHHPTDVEVAALPESVFRLIPCDQAFKPHFTMPSTIQEGERHDTLFKFACSLRAQGNSDSEIQERVSKENTARCKDRNGKTALLSENEITKIIDSACSYPAGKSNNRPSPTYRMMNGRTIWDKPTKDGTTEIQLANFECRIIEEEVHDDGQSATTMFRLAGKLASGRTLPDLSVPADRFPSLNWAVEHWGAQAIVSAGFGAKDRLRCAIQELSGDIDRRTLYSHTGWRKIGSEWFYLNAAGAIGRTSADRSIQVELNQGKLNDYSLPEPDEDIEPLAITASMSFLELAPKDITIPIFCSIFRATLGEVLPIDFSLFLVGPTGNQKSELSAMAQAHYGQAFTSRNLPDNWSSTANSLERKAFLLKDALFCVDDFAPNGSKFDADKLHRDAERLLRAQGNRAGRGRLTSDSQLKYPNYPRCLILSSGEDIPRGQSLRSRMLILELAPGSVNLDRLSKFQELARSGIPAQVMSSFLRYLASNLDRYRKELPLEHRRLRLEAEGVSSHRRTPDLIASLQMGMQVFVDFTVLKGGMTQNEAQRLCYDSWNALTDVADRQQIHSRTEDPAHRFMMLLRSLIHSGKAHFVPLGTFASEYTTKLGWLSESSDNHKAQGDKIGWLSNDETELWLDPELTYAAVQKLARDQGEAIIVTKNTLWKRLAERGLILTPENNRIVVRRRPEGQRSNVIIMPAINFLGGDEENAVVAATAEQPSDTPMGKDTENHAFSPTELSSEEPRQTNAPTVGDYESLTAQTQ